MAPGGIGPVVVTARYNGVIPQSSSWFTSPPAAISILTISLLQETAAQYIAQMPPFPGLLTSAPSDIKNFKKILLWLFVNIFQNVRNSFFCHKMNYFMLQSVILLSKIQIE